MINTVLCIYILKINCGSCPEVKHLAKLWENITALGQVASCFFAASRELPLGKGTFFHSDLLFISKALFAVRSHSPSAQAGDLGSPSRCSVVVTLTLSGTQHSSADG